MFTLIESIASWALNLISATGYAGLFIAMALESAGVPIPSEVVLPFAGFLSSTGRFSLVFVIIATTLANLTGSVIFYFIGYYGGTAFLRKYGHLLLIHDSEISKMEHWFQKHGGKVAFYSRLFPGVRTYSSLVIGAGKSNLPIFVGFTLLGSVFWNSLWSFMGYFAGNRWNVFAPYVRKFDYLIIAGVLIFIVIFFVRHFHKAKI